MKDSTFERLAKRWPSLFEKAEIQHIECGDGWFDIIDVLCQILSKDVERIDFRTTYCRESLKTQTDEVRIEDLHAQIETITIERAIAVDMLPVIVQVKEKFGTMRFYCRDTIGDHQNYIDFAEAMSARTCEECGAPGHREHPNQTWIKTLCNHHAKERADRYAVVSGTGRILPHISDDE